MAKVTGPLMSLDASGTVGGVATFSKWKGRNYVRLRVIPQNMRTAGQQLVRGFTAAISKAAQAVLTAAKDTLPGMGAQFFLDTATHIAGTNSWIAIFQRNEHSQITADNATYGGLGGVATLYEAQAADMGLQDYITVGDIPVTYTAGFQLYILAKFAVNSLGCTSLPDGIDSATAPQLSAFGDYVQLSV